MKNRPAPESKARQNAFILFGALYLLLAAGILILGFGNALLKAL